jgi:hypothetical protein
MSVRSWTVGVLSTATVVAGLVVVQSGIPGTAALPILPHRAVAPAPPGAELPAPAEVSAPPPAAGTVREAPVVRADVVSEQRSATDRPAKRARHAAEKPDKPDGPGDAGGPGKDAGKDSGKDSGKGPGEAGRQPDAGGGPDHG